MLGGPYESSGPSPSGSLTPAEIGILIATERTGAGLSMIAIVLTLLSFIALKKLRTKPNLFLVFASVANAGASVASMMGYDGLRQGQESALCQAQALIFEWFMQSDSWWSLAMAINVFLVFFCNANPACFRRHLWAYCVVCFGGPMIPAIVLITIRGDARGLVYGDAALWCWIGNNWSLVRLYAYCIPIWICILLSFVIHIAVGCHVFHQRNQLLSINLHEQLYDSNVGKLSRSGSGGDKSGDSAHEARSLSALSLLDILRTNTIWQSLTRRQDGYGTVITEVQITSTLPPLDLEPSILATFGAPGGLTYKPSWASGSHGDCPNQGANEHHRFETICSSASPRIKKRSLLNLFNSIKAGASIKFKRLDPVKMAYLHTSFIFGFAVLVTWIPSSVNRLYSLANDGRISFHLSVASGCVLPLQGVWNALIYLTTS